MVAAILRCMVTLAASRSSDPRCCVSGGKEGYQISLLTNMCHSRFTWIVPSSPSSTHEMIMNHEHWQPTGFHVRFAFMNIVDGQEQGPGEQQYQLDCNNRAQFNFMLIVGIHCLPPVSRDFLSPVPLGPGPTMHDIILRIGATVKGGGLTAWTYWVAWPTTYPRFVFHWRFQAK